MYVFRPSARRLRHIVWLTLLAWLFALSAGVVNACVLSLPDAATSGLKSANRLESAWLVSNRHLPKSDTHAGPQAHGTAAVGQGDHGQDTGKDPCLKFCSDESKALPKGKSFGSDLAVVFVADVAWYLASAPTPSVASPNAATPASMAAMQDHTKAMQEMHDKMMNAKTPRSGRP